MQYVLNIHDECARFLIRSQRLLAHHTRTPHRPLKPLAELQDSTASQLRELAPFLMTSGLPERWWPLAMAHQAFCCSASASSKDGLTPCERRFVAKHPFKVDPSGALVLRKLAALGGKLIESQHFLWAPPRRQVATGRNHTSQSRWPSRSR